MCCFSAGPDPNKPVAFPNIVALELGFFRNRRTARDIRTLAIAVEGPVMKEAADRMGFTQIIEQSGGYIVADTCMVVSPIEKMGIKTTGVNSGKAANYLPGFCKQEVVFGNIETLIEEVK